MICFLKSRNKWNNKYLQEENNDEIKSKDLLLFKWEMQMSSLNCLAIINQFKIKPHTVESQSIVRKSGNKRNNNNKFSLSFNFSSHCYVCLRCQNVKVFSFPFSLSRSLSIFQRLRWDETILQTNNQTNIRWTFRHP